MYVCMYVCLCVVFVDTTCRQMLMDLDESHNLIERFKQSDQLEKLDQLLHSWQARGASEVGGGSQMKLL